jgi:tryptophan synthase alpha chain
MSTLERACRTRRTRGERALVPFVTAGFPDERTSLELLVECGRRGCEVVEVGVPFSDPVADGPVIQHASQVALANGMTLSRALALVRDVAADGILPVMMTYLNPVLRFGFTRFAREAAAAGCAGVIVPDLSVEDAAPLREALLDHGVALVDLVAPTTPDDRLRRIAGAAGGFLYLVSVTGVTGTHGASAERLAPFVGRVRHHTDLPLYVGFGIDGPERARDAAAHADGVIVGSALIRRLDGGPDRATCVANALALVDHIRAALHVPADTPIPR